MRFRSALSGQVVGHGVLVDDEHVVTCAHVVNAVLGRSLLSTESAVGEIVRLEFPLLAEIAAFAPERRARVDAWAAPGVSGDAFDGVDVAGLSLVGEPRPAGAIPIRLADGPSAEGTVLLFGPVQGRPGGWVPALLRPIVKQYRQQIEQQAHGAHVAQPGYSGTPIVDPTASKVLGILVATAVGREDVDVYAIPLPVLIATWPNVFAPLPANPYKGLEAFRTEDVDLFYGRTAVTDELERRVDTQGLLPVVGASGVGKSSLVHAGLIPRLHTQRTSWTTVSIRPRPQLLGALAAGFAVAAGATRPVPVDQLERWQSRICTDVGSAGELLLSSTGADRLLLVIDQFEEAVDESEQSASLLAQLAALADRTRSPIVAALTMREDSFGRLFVRPGDFGEVLRRTAVALHGMNERELRDAIAEPAARRGIEVPEPLVRELVRSVHGRPGALPLLEFALGRMWATLERGRTALSFDGYQGIGRLDGALAEYADAVLQALTPEERAVVRHLFLTQLISPDRPDVRRVARRADMPPAEWTVALRLANERLLTTARGSDGAETVEVVHEALLVAWETLTGWLQEEQPFRRWRQLLAFSMAQPERETGSLAGALLLESERWLAERPADIGVEERLFIEAGRAAQNREEHRYRMLYQQSLARTLTLAVADAEDPRLALLLAVEALEHSPGPEADGLVRSCLHRIGAAEHVVVGPECDRTDLARAGTRRTLMDWIQGAGDTVSWPVGGGQATVGLDGSGNASVQWGFHGAGELAAPGPVVCGALAADIPVLCLATEQGELSLYQLSDRAELIGSLALGIGVMCVALDATAEFLAASCDDGTTRLLTTGEGISELLRVASSGFVLDLDLSANGASLALLHHDGRLAYWDLTTRTVNCRGRSELRASRIGVAADVESVILGRIGPTGLTPVGRVPVGSAALAARARVAAGRELTKGERERYLGAEIRPGAVAP